MKLREELESTFDGKVLKLESSQLQRIYDYHKHDSALLFLRKGVGLLYPADDPDNPDNIFDFFNEARDPIVKELDDSNFEHLTQASTGSTTGDWLIQFYDSQCVDCNRLSATWETVGAKLKRRMNVARVNRGTKGILTAKRFKVEQAPEFIFLRGGKYYRYNLKKYDDESFVGFATSWYSRVAAEKVAPLASPFENLVDLVVDKLKSMNLSSQFLTANLPILAIIGIFFVLLIFLKLKKSSPETEVKVDKKEE